MACDIVASQVPFRDSIQVTREHASQFMDNDTSEIKTLKRIVWRTAASGRLERFAALLNDPETQKYFGDEFVRRLSAKIDRHSRTILVMAAIYAILMLSLLAAQDTNKTEFQILGYSFKNLGYYKEFLLFTAASISPISAAVSAYHRYLSTLRTTALNTMFQNADVREFATHIYSDEFFDPLLKDHRASLNRPHGFASFLVATFGMALLSIFVALIAASFILQATVIYDVATNPSSSRFINLFIVIFSICAISLSWLIGILQLPLPEVDLSTNTKLSALRERDKAKYNETMLRLAAESAKRERTWSIGSSIGFFVVAYSVCAVLQVPDADQRLGQLFARAIPGAVVAVFVATFIATRIKRSLYRSYFRTYPEGSDIELKAFARFTTAVSVARLALPAVASTLYSVAALRNL